MAYRIKGLVEGIVAKVQSDHNLRLVGFDEQSRAGYTLVPNYLWDLKISFIAKNIYACLLGYAWNHDYCFPGQDAIAKKLGLSRWAVNTHLKELERAGLIKKIRRGWTKTNVYILYCRPIKKTKK